MKLSRLLAGLLIIAALTFAVAAHADVGKASWPLQLRFMSGPPGGNWFTLGESLSEIFSSEGLPSTSSTAGAGVSNILNIHARRGDLGFSVTSLLGAALKGEADFKGRRINNAVIMANLYTQYTYFIIRKDFALKNKIKSVEDIINQKLAVRFATLKPGTGSEFVIKALFEKAYGLDYRKIFQDWGGSVEYVSYDGGADLLVKNYIDCFAFSVGKVAATIMNIERQADIILLPIGQEALDKLSYAYGTVTLTIEPGVYKSLPEGSPPVKTVGDYTCLVARKDLPASLVYELNKAIWEHKAGLAASVIDMEELEPSIALPEKIPAHEGAIKFWKEVSK